MDVKNRSWLMILDNTDSIELFFSSRNTVDTVSDESSLFSFLPRCSHSCILITTRDTRIGIRIAEHVDPIHVTAMDIEEAKALIKFRSPSQLLHGDHIEALA
jgi:hypothetical protein